jgi:hypothetical protein
MNGVSNLARHYLNSSLANLGEIPPRRGQRPCQGVHGDTHTTLFASPVYIIRKNGHPHPPPPGNSPVAPKSAMIRITSLNNKRMASMPGSSCFSRSQQLRKRKSTNKAKAALPQIQSLRPVSSHLFEQTRPSDCIMANSNMFHYDRFLCTNAGMRSGLCVQAVRLDAIRCMHLARRWELIERVIAPSAHTLHHK